MPCNNVSFQALVDYFDNANENNFENNAWHLKHNADKVQEILNRIIQGILSIITSALAKKTFQLYLQSSFSKHSHTWTRKSA